MLFDLDGVLYNGGQPIAGAAAAVNTVREMGYASLFVTNTTSRPRAAVAAKLAAFGIAAETERILTPPVAAADWMRRNGPGPAALFVPESTKADFAGLPEVAADAQSGARFVVVGDLGPAWDFQTLNRAFRLLHNDADARLIALGMTRYWRAPDGVALDVAPFAAALERAAGKTATVLGKPSPEFFAAAAAMLGLGLHELLMVGDDIRADVAGAQAAGLQAALVRTGKFRPQDLEGEVKPDAALDSVRDLPALLAATGAERQAGWAQS